MKKIKIIARQNILNAYTKKPLDDQGVRALDGYFESKLYTVEDSYNADSLIDKFNKDYPEIKADTYTIVEQEA